MDKQPTEPDTSEPFRHEVFWYMDSEFCECGELLDDFGVCMDCGSDGVDYDEEDDGWAWADDEEMYADTDIRDPRLYLKKSPTEPLP